MELLELLVEITTIFIFLGILPISSPIDGSNPPGVRATEGGPKW
jgi:hypothetical protein